MKTSGAIKNLVQGVSTQHPKERLEGQSWAQTNTIPDPTEGAVKRPGVRHVQSVYAELPSATPDLPLTFRTVAVPQGEFAVGTYDGRIIVRDLDTGNTVPVVQDPDTYGYFAGGVVASTNVGEYTLLGGTSVPQVTQQVLAGIGGSAWQDNSYGGALPAAAVNRVVVVEIRQGAYSGVYRVLRNTGAVLATYTVPNGSTGTDSVNVQPAYIANQLYVQLRASIGGAVGSGIIRGVHQQGASIAIFLQFEALDEAAALFADDGFYNTRMVLSDRFSTTASTLPSVGVEGHVMEIGKANSRTGNYFLRFEHTQGQTGGSTSAIDTNKLRPGRWVETSRSYVSTGYSNGGVLTEQTLPSLMFFYEGIAYVGSGTYIAAQVLANTDNVITPLTWGRRVAGSDDSAEDPYFVGSVIRWLGIFQDRLVVVSDGAVTMSRTGDYLNFYRASVIDDLATDPINLTSTFDATDKLVGAALLDKNLIVIGTKTHYAIVGRTGITPTNGALLKTSSFESSPNVAPVSFGNYVYFSSASEKNSDVLAIQPSETVDSTTAYSVSSHVDGYIPGSLTHLVASTKLNILFALAESGVLYCYRTLFNQSERVLSAWFDFEFPSDLVLRTIAVDNTKIRMLFAVVVDGGFYTTVGELNLDRTGYTGTNRHRYLDFWEDVSYETYPVVDTSVKARAAFSREAPILVDSTNNLADGAGVQTGTQSDPEFSVTYSELVPTRTYMIGVPYLTKFDPTTPLARTFDGKVTSIGKLVIGHMKVNYSVGAQFDVHVTDKYRSHVYTHSARKVSAPDSFVGEDYVREGFFLVPVGSAETSARISIQTYDHYPLVLSSIDWTGQFSKRGTNM